MQEYNIKMRRYNGVDYDTLYPATNRIQAAVTLTTNGWSNKEQTVSVSGVTASNAVIVSPAPTSIKAYSKYGIYCSEQASGTLTFVCDKTPSEGVVVNVLIPL